MLEQPRGHADQAVLGRGRQLPVERLDLLPVAVTREDLVRGGVGLEHLAAVVAVVLSQPVREGHAHAVGDGIGEDRRDDLALELMLLELVGILLHERGREVLQQIADEEGIVRHVALQRGLE